MLVYYPHECVPKGLSTPFHHVSYWCLQKNMLVVLLSYLAFGIASAPTLPHRFISPLGPNIAAPWCCILIMFLTYMSSRGREKSCFPYFILNIKIYWNYIDIKFNMPFNSIKNTLCMKQCRYCGFNIECRLRPLYILTLNILYWLMGYLLSDLDL